MILVHHGSSIMKLTPSVSVGMTWEALSCAMTKKVLKRTLSWTVTAHRAILADQDCEENRALSCSEEVVNYRSLMSSI